ncbi:MAG: EAL domain-containing protein [Neorhizobium sp.]|nr:EAL domain-containing protein [Neorhizobium sp.]
MSSVSHAPEPAKGSRLKSKHPSWLGPSYFLPALLAAVAVIIGVIRIDTEERAQHHATQRLAASEQLAKVASGLETNIHGNVNLVHGLVAAVAANPTMGEAQFAAVAERIFAAPSQLRNVAAAPDMVVRFVYPYVANSRVLGLDYRTSPEQGPAAMEAVQRRQPVITGPINLLQGGQGLVARYPVFAIGNGRFWGVLSAVIDVNRLYADSDLDNERQTLDIAISRRPIPKDGDVFYGDREIFSKSPVRTHVDLGYDTWYLAAVPKAGWEENASALPTIRTHVLVIALCIIGPLIWVGLLMRQRQSHITTLQEREEQLETLHQRLALALKASSVGVWEYEPSTNTLYWDAKMCELYGVPHDRDDFHYSAWCSALHPDDFDDAQRLLVKTLEDDTPYLTQFRIVTPAGDIRHIRAHGVTYRTSSGRQRIVGANWDVTSDTLLQTELRDARASAEEQNEQLRATRHTLEYQSLHDALTGLPNRRFLDQFMDDATQAGPGHPLTLHPTAFIHCDLDRFKEVNDTLGHAAGDAVLREAALRLTALLDVGEFASRIGGDEFVIVTSGDMPMVRARHLAAAIIQALARPILIEGRQCNVGCSAGIACQTTAGDDLRQLLVNADVALYEAKKRGRNRAELFSEELLTATIQTRRISDELLAALRNDEIVAFYQPQFCAQTLDIVGVEALARWQHPTRGLLAPGEFLGIAEDMHRSAAVDAAVLDKALFQASRWQALDLDIPNLSVNISAQRLKDETLIESLKKAPFVPGRLSFELLESISFDGEDNGIGAIITELKALGIAIEVDDFGTGHASIVSLIELGPKRLKIDRRLIAPLEASGSQRRLVSSIIDIGRSQGIEIVAEGVETPAHVEILRSLGCQVLQGYALARPMSSADFASFARNWQEGNRKVEVIAAAGRRRR